MRILFVNQYFPPDATNTAYLVGELAEDLARSHEVWVVAGRPSYNPEASTFRPSGVRVKRSWSTAFPRASMLGRLVNYGSFMLGALLQVLRVPRPDVILAYTDPPIVALLALAASVRHRCPFVFVYYDLHPEVGLAMKRVDNAVVVWALRRINRLLRRRATRVVAIGRDMVDKLKADGVPETRIALQPNWSNDEVVLAGEVLRTREAMGWGDRFVIMHAGNAGLAQGLETLVETAELLRGEEQVLFVIVGDGAARRGLEHRVRAMNLQNVLFLPHRPKQEVASLVASADVHLISLVPGLRGCVVPSKVYGIMAASRPFIAAVDNGSEIALIAEENDCGVTVRPADPKALADAILHIRKAHLDEMGARARRAFESRYSRSVRTGHFERFLRTVVDETRGSAI